MTYISSEIEPLARNSTSNPGRSRRTLSTPIFPPIASTSRRLIVSPSPVPPKRLVVEAEKLRKGFGDKLLFDEPSFRLPRGGIVGVIDHHADAGAPPETGDTLHRIDPAIVMAGMEAAGFDFEKQSDILRNPDDDLSKTVFAPELRGKTDRFLMRFRRPK